MTEAKIIPEPWKKHFNERQRVDYRSHRESFLEWLAVFGKNPDQADGYSETVVQNTAYRTDQFYRWVWGRDGYTTTFDHSEADEYIQHLAGLDHSNSHKSKQVEALKRLFKWFHFDIAKSAYQIINIGVSSSAFFSNRSCSLARFFGGNFESSEYRIVLTSSDIRIHPSPSKIRSDPERYPPSSFLSRRNSHIEGETEIVTNCCDIYNFTHTVYRNKGLSSTMNCGFKSRVCAIL